MYGQTDTENYTKTTKYKVATQDGIVEDDYKIESVTYFDGLNRPKQNVGLRAGGNREDLVTHIEYDEFGRKSREYLPLSVAGNNGDYYSGSIITSDLNSFYYGMFGEDFDSEINANPFNEVIFDDSPLNKVIKTAHPGSDWKASGDHTIISEYDTNGKDEVRLFRVVYDSGGEPSLEEDGFYPENVLIKNVVKNENWTNGLLNTTEDFIDKSGRTVLSNIWVDGGGFGAVKVSTYFVHDDQGRLIYKLTPEQFAHISGPGYADYTTSWAMNDFIESFGYVNGLLIFSIQDDVLSINRLQAIPPPQVVPSRLKLQTVKSLGVTPVLEDRYLGKVYGVTSSGDEIHAGDLNIVNGDLVLDRISSDLYDNFAVEISIDLTTSYDQNGIDKLGFQYRYDEQNRLIEKKSPGKEWEYVVYNSLDQPVFTQDLNLRNNGQWMFTKYDAFGRKAYTGIVDYSPGRESLQNLVDTYSGVPFEKRRELPLTVAGTPIYYTNDTYNTTFLLNITAIHTVDYYDDYVDHAGLSLPPTVFGVSTNVETKGLPVVSRVRVLDTNDWIVTLSGYDEEGRVIYNSSKNQYLNTTDIIKNRLDYFGNTLETESSHSKGLGSPLITKDYYSYDHMDRLLVHQQRIGTDNLQLITNNEYNALGQLVTKRVGGQPFEDGYDDLVNVVVNPTTSLIYKSGTSNNFDAGLITVGQLEANGGITWKTPNADSWSQVGLNDQSNSAGADELDYFFNYYTFLGQESVFQIKSRNYLTNELQVLHSGTYEANDVFAIEWSDGVMKYIQNGIVIYNETLPFAAPNSLIGDLSFKTPGASVQDFYLYATEDTETSLQKVDYQYNIRGWLTNINDVNEQMDGWASSDLFKFRLNYNKVEGNVGTAGVVPLYNGDIAQSIWRSKNTDTNKRGYGYVYDELSRITKAHCRKGLLLDQVEYQNLWNVTYDLNGNIKTMNRNGYNDSNNPFEWDNLVYTYDGNRLTQVADNASNPYNYLGFNDENTGSPDYTYDDNGNLKSDANKGILNINYNHLNLPKSIHFNTSGSTSKTIAIYYTYDALGNKIAKNVVDGSGILSLTHYAGNILYYNNQLQFITQPEGYIDPIADFTLDGGKNKTSGNDYQYVFQYKDHVNNVRLSYADLNNDGNVTTSEIIEESNYYPFGLKQKGYNTDISSSGNAIAQQWKFADTQLQEELDLDWYDFGARNYDASLGRWFNPDPKNQFASPYLYAYNNPISSVDPDGEFAILAGFAIGAIVGGVSTAIANPNADFGDILTGAAIGGITGVVTAGIGSAISGATTTATATIFGATISYQVPLSATTQAFLQAGSHAFLQGTISSTIGGGSFGEGALNGAVSSGIASITAPLGLGAQIASGGISSGITSEIQGGSFAKGFTTGIIVSGLNHGLHRGAQATIWPFPGKYFGRLRHLMGPDAVVLGINGDIAGPTGGADVSTGVLLILRGPAAGTAVPVTDLAVAFGLDISIGVNFGELYFTGHASDIKVDTFLGARFGLDFAVNVYGLDLGVGATFAPSPDPNDGTFENAVIGVSATVGVGVPGFLVSANGNYGYTFKTEELIDFIKNR
ncbi:MAG: hypothetical protein Aureis2KO_09270 [Aureisphaera sp.]